MSTMRKNKELSMLSKDIFQSNELVKACKDMNTSCYRLFLFGVQALRPHITDAVEHDEEFPLVMIPYADMLEAFNHLDSSLRNVVKNVQKAFDSSIVIYTETGGFILRHIYDEMRYEPQQGLYVQFNAKMRPYLLDLMNKAYTRFAMKDTFILESSYAWRLCELMMQYRGYFKKGKKEIYRKFTIDELRFALGVQDGLYTRLDNFKKRILDDPIAEINTKTSYCMRYEQYREGRRIAGFTIFMQLKKGATVPTVGEADGKPPAIETAPAEKGSPDRNKRDFRRTLKQEGLTQKQISSLLSEIPFDNLLESYRIADEQAKKRHLKDENRTKYLVTCLSQNIADERNKKAEIIQREQNAIAEKKEKEREMAEGFKKIGLSSDEPRGKGLETSGDVLASIGVPQVNTEPVEQEEKPKPKNLTPEQVAIVKAAIKSGLSEERLNDLAKRYGYTSFGNMRGLNWKNLS